MPVFGGDVGIVFHLEGSRKVVHNPIVMVFLPNGLDDTVGADPTGFGHAQVGNADLLAIHFLLHFEDVGGTFNPIPGQEFSQIFIVHLGSPLRLAKGKLVIVNWQESLGRCHFVHLEFDTESFL